MEPRFGAEIITKKGKIFKFDDAHCVANYISNKKIDQNNIKQTLFIDYSTESSFVKGEEAWFVVSPKLKSPMNSNAAAFPSRDAADKKAAKVSGAVKNWKSLAQEL